MDVMMNMTTEDVRRLREKFVGSLTLDQFVLLMKKTLHDRIHSELDFVVGAIDLFHTIDVNGDETLDWDEFAGYMMDAGKAKADSYFEDISHAKHYKHLIMPPRDAKTPMNNIKTHIQQMVFMAELSSVAYFEYDSDVVYLYGLHFDQNDGPRHISLIRLHTAFQEHTVIGIEYISMKRLLAISSVLSVGYLSIWSLQDLHSPVMVHRVESNAAHEHLCWVDSIQCLVTSSVVFPAIAKNKSRDSYRPNSSTQAHTKISQLLLWDVLGKVPVTKELRGDDRVKGVSAITTYKSINRTYLAVGLEDGVISVVDGESGEDICSFDAHGNGVKALVYSTHVECLASVGFYSYLDETTLHISIWKKTGTRGRLTLETTLRGHESPIDLIAFVDSKQQLISLDTSGLFRVFSSVVLSSTSDPWECVQTFQHGYGHALSSQQSHVLNMFVVPESDSSDAVLVTAGRTVEFYEICDDKEREEVFFAYYCCSLNLLMGVTATKLLFWTADSGKLWKSYSYKAIVSVSPDSNASSCSTTITTRHPRCITAVCMDDRERKVIVGDDAGSVKIINPVNGNVMKELDPHQEAVLSVAYVLRSKCVISISMNSVLHICDENNAQGFYVPYGGGHPQSVLRYSLHLQPNANCIRDYRSSHYNTSGNKEEQDSKFEILRSIANMELNLVAVLIAGSNGESFIQVWNFDFSHTQGGFTVLDNAEITCMSFFGSSSDIVCGTNSGSVYLWSLSKYEGNYRVLMELQSMVMDIADDVFGSSMLFVAAIYTGKPPSTEMPTTNSQNPVSVASVTKNPAQLFPESYSIEERIQQESTGMHVFAGDEAGYITSWYVQRHHDSGLINSTTASAGVNKGKPSVNNNSASYQHEEMILGYDAVTALYQRARLANLNDNRHEDAPSWNTTKVTAIRRWMAHSGPILSLTFGTDPFVIISSSVKGKIKIWSFEGGLLGILDHFATRRHPAVQPWLFPVDMAERRREKEAQAKHFVRRGADGFSKRNNQQRSSILQDRLSLTAEDLEFNHSTRVKHRRSAAWSRTRVRASDVGRAVRNYILAQTVSKKKDQNAVSRVKDVHQEASLHSVLQDLNQLEDHIAHSGSSNGHKSHPSGNTDKSRKKYAMVTLSDLKYSRPRSSSVHCAFPDSPEPPSNTSRKNDTFHQCTLSKSLSNQNVLMTRKPAEVVINPSIVPKSSRNLSDAAPVNHFDLLDIHEKVSSSVASNNPAPMKERKQIDHSASNNAVLKYHVRLAHSWQQYQSQ